VVNADSMQVYTEIPVLTAQPLAEERIDVPHRLYGHVPAATAYSVGRWLADVRAVLAEAANDGLRPIIVGGTGLYFKALIDGLSLIPDIPEMVRRHWRREAEQRPAAELHALLSARDPAMAARLASGDAQRIVRALEVLDATGRPLSAWQQDTSVPLLDIATVLRIQLDPPRAWLRTRCETRFAAMLADGALDEVRGLAAQGLSSELPAMRALGVAPLMDHLAGHCDLSAAAARATLDTARYVKRQQTWFRKFMTDWPRFDPSAMATDALADAIMTRLMPA
jgi:tRNA dimethylallyltransferase